GVSRRNEALMSTLFASTARTARARMTRPAGRRAWAVAVPLAATVLLAAGCGSAHSGTPDHPPAPATSATASGTSPAAPAKPATPVPTVSGGHVAEGEIACAGWPGGGTS